MKTERQRRLAFLDLLIQMDIMQFHAFCGMLWDEENAVKMKWDLWPGVRGYPGQGDVLQSYATEKYSWLLKARRRGGSEMAAFVQLKECVTHDKYETTIISKKDREAKYYLKRRLLRQLQAAYSLEYSPGLRFPWPEYKDNSDTGKIVWENESVAEALSSDNEEARGRNTNLIVFDEMRTFLNKDAEELWSSMTPIINSKPFNRGIFLSSAKFGSWANAMTKAIMDGDVEGIKFLFMPADTDPAYTPDVRAQELRLSMGDALYIQENPLEPEDCFAGREGAVFRAYDPLVGGRHVNPVKLDWGLKYCIVYDQGKQHPAVLLLCLYDRYVDHLYVFDEVFCRGMDLPEVGFAIREKLNFYKRNHGAPDPAIKIADSAIFAQTGSSKTIAAELKSVTGINFSPSKKPGRQYGMDRINSRFSNGRLTIDPRCVQTRKQIEELPYKRQSGEPRAEEILKVEDDAPSCLAYLDDELNPGQKEMPKKEALESVLIRKKRAQEFARQGLRTGGDALGGSYWA